MIEQRWWWLRHAPIPSPEPRIHGQLDLACDTSDEELFKALADGLPRQPVLVESGLMRSSQTTGALEAAGLALPPAIIEPDFREQHFGRWQGRAWNDLAAAKDPDLPAFWRDPGAATPPGGESFAAVIERVRAGIERLSVEHPTRDIVAVAHAGTIRAALATALDLDPAAALRFQVDCLSLTRIDRIGDGWRVVSVNHMVQT